KLDGDGEYLGLVMPDGVTVACEYSPTFPKQASDVSYGLAMNVVSNSLVASGASGHFLIPAGDLGVAWTQVGYEDSAWLSGGTGSGYDTGTNYASLIRTDLRAAMLGVNASAYARIPFTITDPSAVNQLRLRMLYDDGFVAYLNGQQIFSRNAPLSPVWNSS